MSNLLKVVATASLRVRALLLTTLSIISVWSSALAAEYRITPLGTLGGARSFTSQLDDRARVVGGSSVQSSAQHAFIWVGGVMEDLGVPDGYLVSNATALNRYGRIVGYTNGEYQSQYAYLWEGGIWTYLGTLPGEGLEYSVATDINDDSRICGYSFNVGPGSSRRAWIWENGEMTDLGTLGGDRSSANAINEHGQIVGYSQIYDPEDYRIHAFLWEDGDMTDLGVLPGETNSTALDINEHGQIVGSSSHQMQTYPFLTIYTPCLWDNGKILNLGIPPGYDRGVATGINDDGTIVAWMDTSLSGGPSYAFVWRDGEWAELNSLVPQNSQWDLQAATDINDRGQIIGNGIPRSGSIQGFLLTPVQKGVKDHISAALGPEFIQTGNFPNPFNVSTTIEFELTGAAFVTLEIFNVTGQKTATLLESDMQPGSHSIVWDASDQPSGIYYYRIKAGGESDAGRMVLLK